MTPAQIKALVALLLAVGVIAGGFSAVRAYNGAIADKALLETKVGALEQAAADNAVTIARLQENAKADAAALEAKETEAKAYREALVASLENYKNGIKNLPEADRACAGRTVPGAVDRLLSQGNR